MLYCPKCRRTYDDGSQRFCSSDGGRLLPALSAANKTIEGKQGVFSRIISKTSSAPSVASRRVEKIGEKQPPPIPRSLITETESEPPQPPSTPAPQTFSAPALTNEPQPVKRAPEASTQAASPTAGEIFKIEQELKPKFGTVSVEVKPTARLIKPSEIASGTASVGDRSANPTGRLPISWKNPDALIGQTVKGRYQVTEKINQDETIISFLALDKLSTEQEKKVVVRVLMDEDAADDLAHRIYAEERVSLSHLNHPNVAGMIDSGELLEGKIFIISEYVEGQTVKDKLDQSGQLNSQRVARIVRQVAYALSEVHQNGILHRNLTPEKIILTVNEAGTEQVKVTDFAITDGKQSARNLVYRSPEQLEGKLPNFASDIYSLAVIAYQMLTNRLPFNGSTAGELLNSQRHGLAVKPSSLRLELQPLVDEILTKALAFKASDRYPKARDFGDAFFNAMTTVAPWSKAEAEKDEEVLPLPMTTVADVSISPEKEEDFSYDDVEIEIIDDEEETEIEESKNSTPEHISFKSLAEETVSEAKAENKPAPDLPWEKRSPEPIKVASKSWMLLSVLGLVALVAGLWLVWFYFLNRSGQSNFTPAESQQSPQENASNNPGQENGGNLSQINIQTPVPEEIESPPLERKILQPPNTEYFQNTRENLDTEMARFYRGFTFFYPKEWVKTPSQKNFVDVSRKSESGIPIEQMLVSYYDSKGTFKDDGEKFPALVKESNKKLAELLPNYRFVSESATEINGGWKVYEMRFEGVAETKTASGEPLKVFGRRIFMPAMRKGVRGGFMITMLATSLSEITKAEEVGEKGELATVLKTFEPSPM